MTDFAFPVYLRHAQQLLNDAGIEHADYEVLVLFSAAAGVRISQVRQWLIMGELPQAVGASERLQIESRFTDFVNRRVQHEPLQYIVGTVGFRFLDIAVGPGVFIPRPETETVVQCGIDWLTDAQQKRALTNPVVVDLCAGTGVVGLSVASEIAGSVVSSVEKDPQAFTWLQRNVAAQKLHHPAINITPVLADATDSHTLEDLNGSVDCVLSNPPYIPESEPTTQPEVDFDPNVALYGGSADGMRIPELVIRRAALLLRDGGFLVVEHDISQGAAMVSAMEEAGFTQAFTHNDLTGRPRYTSAVHGVSEA